MMPVRVAHLSSTALPRLVLISCNQESLSWSRRSL